MERGSEEHAATAVSQRERADVRRHGGNGDSGARAAHAHEARATSGDQETLAVVASSSMPRLVLRAGGTGGECIVNARGASAGDGDGGEAGKRFASRYAVAHYLKLRKRFHFPLVTYKVGANVDLRTGQVVYLSSLRDRVLNGKLSVDGARVRLSKQFRMDNARVTLNGLVDCSSGRSMASVRVQALGTYRPRLHPPGCDFAVKRALGRRARLRVQAKGMVELPEAHCAADSGGTGRHGTVECASRGVSAGYSDIVLQLDELNLCYSID